jgi:hypothetical protein
LHPQSDDNHGVSSAVQHGLSAEQITQLRQAWHAAKKIRRARSVAMSDASVICFFAAITVAGGAFGLPSITPALLLGLAMTLVAVIEFRGAAGLGRLEVSAASRLGWNQVAFAFSLCAYAGWNIAQALLTKSGGLSADYAAIASQSPDAAEMVQSLDSLTHTATAAFYALLIGVALLVQGGTALYYFTRTRHVRAYVHATPPWIIELQKAGVSI